MLNNIALFQASIKTQVYVCRFHIRFEEHSFAALCLMFIVPSCTANGDAHFPEEQ